jgi:hypothetical protein
MRLVPTNGGSAETDGPVPEPRLEEHQNPELLTTYYLLLTTYYLLLTAYCFRLRGVRKTVSLLLLGFLCRRCLAGRMPAAVRIVYNVILSAGTSRYNTLADQKCAAVNCNLRGARHRSLANRDDCCRVVRQTAAVLRIMGTSKLFQASLL